MELTKQASNELDQTVTISYGTMTNRPNTGDATTITNKDVEENCAGKCGYVENSIKIQLIKSYHCKDAIL
jgi:hypothetical protein